jgi:hypothetical protein
VIETCGIRLFSHRENFSSCFWRKKRSPFLGGEFGYDPGIRKVGNNYLGCCFCDIASGSNLYQYRKRMACDSLRFTHTKIFYHSN